MIQSMTGYGKTVLQLPTKKITIELKSLNSKNLDLNVRIPSYYREKELNVRKKLASALVRGKVDFSIYIENNGGEGSSKINENVVKALHRLESDLQSIERIEELNKIFDLLQELDLEQDVWQSQNLYFSMAKNRKAMGQMVYNQDWVNTFVQLGKHLNVKINFQDILAKV